MDNNTPSDKIFAVTLKDKKIFRLTNNVNGVYQPAINSKGSLLFSAFTADGSRLATIDAAQIHWQLVDNATVIPIKNIGTFNALNSRGSGALYQLTDTKNTISKYSKSFKLFNFHSWRPLVSDPEYG